MICRLWRGWTTPGNADAYEKIVRGEVIPGIEARSIPGFRHIDLMKRDLGDEVEFQTLMWFDSLDAIKAFMGEDYAVSHVPAAARAVLSRFDGHAAHFELLERRSQPCNGSACSSSAKHPRSLQRGLFMIRSIACRAGIFSLSLIASTAAFAEPAAPPPVVATPAPSAATPARMALAKELVGYTQPKELMLRAVLTGWEMGVAEQDADYQAELEAIQPGLSARLAERGKAELVTLVAEQIPQMHDRLAALFAGNCTEEELKAMIAFYSSPAGAKMIRSITMSDSGGEAFDDEQFTAAEATSANRAAAREAVKTLDGDEWLATVKFSVSPGGRVVKALGPQVQAISAEWMTNLMAVFGKRIEPIAEEMVKRAIEEADKQAGGN